MNQYWQKAFFIPTNLFNALTHGTLNTGQKETSLENLTIGL